METQKGSIEPIKVDENPTISEKKFEVNFEKYQQFKSWQAKAIDEYENYKINAPEDVLEPVPRTLRDQLKIMAKNELIKLEQEMAKQKLVDLNTPFRYKREEEIKIDFRNFQRQIPHCEAKLKQMEEASTDFYVENKLTTHAFDVRRTIDKLNSELKLLELEMDLYGMDKEEVLKDL